MQRKKRFLELAWRIIWLGVLTLALIVVINTFRPKPPLAAEPPDPPTENTPYPSPVETSPAPSPIFPLTPTIQGPYSTMTPFPITPFPTLTLRPGPGPTLIPIVVPAKDNAGTIFYIAKSGVDANATLHFLDMDAAGKALNQPMKLSEEEVQIDGFVFPSPDGNRIALTGAWGALNIYDLNKGQLETTLSIGPSGIFFNWFPDSRQILWGEGTLVLTDPFSGEYITLTGPGYGGIISAAASPDGRLVAYGYSEQPIYAPGLWIVNTNGQDAHLLAKGRSPTNIAWSPDGKRIVFWGYGWQVIDADGSNLHELAPEVILPQCYFLPPLWSPDSTTLAVVTSSSAGTFCQGWGNDIYKEANILLIDIESGKARFLLTDQSTGNTDPTWSPDGSQIAFVSNRGGDPEIWVVNVDGSNLRQLTENDSLVRFPLWRRLKQ